MSEQYKYEPIFGDQTLFDSAPEDAVSVRYGKSEYIFDSEEIKATTGQLRDVPVVAMRRIIPGPKRWSVEDQKAGRLPEVGTMVKETKYKVSPQMPSGLGDGYECKVLGIYEGEVCLQFDDGSMRIDSVNNIEPIETDKEKAERLRDEWAESAIDDAYSSIGLPDREKPEHIMRYFRRVYEAMLSGDLPVPAKGE